MSFRYDINGLRAIAVLAVVLFHFNPSWVPGGFAGVDVFFVISGFLMTSIIFRGLENDDFNLFKFYVARANRIIPALAVLCLAMLVFGWLYLIPMDYKALGKHTASTMSFLSNAIYWRESGYFDAASHEKWLLHTWSLSVEWQFYIIYPALLMVLKKFLSIRNIKRLLVFGTVLGFAFSVVATIKWPNPAYYLLPTRAWEMMFGGVAFLYPIALTYNYKKIVEYSGVLLILLSYAFISSDIAWPGHWALVPVLGSYLIIVANRQNSAVTNNIAFQALGKWSYSIYLWHWPIVVGIYQFSLDNFYVYLGIFISVILGFVSNRYIESINLFSWQQWRKTLQVKPFWYALSLIALSSTIFINNGFQHRFDSKYISMLESAKSSPYRDLCHINKYKSPKESCIYQGSEVTWATFGDSHTVEIAYALAERLKAKDEGVKHFSFSGCMPSLHVSTSTSKCANWYKESLDEILNDEKVKNVVFNHRFTMHLETRPELRDEIFLSIDDTINKLSKRKENIYVFYPIPELSRTVSSLIGQKLYYNQDFDSLIDNNLSDYDIRNQLAVSHFNSTTYPSNVHFIYPRDIFCKKAGCYAVMKGKSLYFDDDHPSVFGAELLVASIFLD
ncbi:acyltransferase family protein [Vibrio sp. 10N.261.54.A5]|uniref:acyltransferase family protein n=1 Tax=Vibrio sp. 10N.261.54.A5 TaxID=3229686 RepID=UPI0035500AA0